MLEATLLHLSPGTVLDEAVLVLDDGFKLRVRVVPVGDIAIGSRVRLDAKSYVVGGLDPYPYWALVATG